MGGVVVYGHGAYTFRCRIRDITASDARIVIPAGQPLPWEIHFINLREHTAHMARVVWRRRTEVGLHFLSSIDLAASADPGLEYLKRIWRAKTARVTNISQP